MIPMLTFCLFYLFYPFLIITSVYKQGHDSTGSFGFTEFIGDKGKVWGLPFDKTPL